MKRVLVVRADSLGDVLLAGPAVRAVAASAEVTLLTGPQGSAAGTLLPGVRDLAVVQLPWIDPNARPWQRGDLEGLRSSLAATRCAEAVILTSFHQSALPLAMLLREVGTQRITAISEDFPGTLLDVRVGYDPDRHEVERALDVAAAAGFDLPPGDDGRLRVDIPSSTRLANLPAVDVVVHPASAVATRGIPERTATAVVEALVARGLHVAVTGSRDDRSLTRAVAARGAIDLGGRTDLPQLAAVMSWAKAVVCGNSLAAHLSAAVGTPVVSVFAPVVPWDQWRPYGVPAVRLGDQDAPCAGTRARSCPVPGHPCVSDIPPDDVTHAVASLIGARR